MKRTVTVSEAKRRILEALERMPLIKGHGAPYIPAEVRKASGLPKALFDAAAVELLREGRVYMAEHDHAGRLTDAEREELVYGGERESDYFPGIRRPVYYCSISPRSKAAAA